MVRSLMACMIGFFCASTAFGEEAHLPLPDVCAGNSCNPKQTAIWEEFKQGDNVTADILFKVYSGSCYHQNESYDPDQEHHAIAYIDTHAGFTHYTGRFARNQSENPWKSWTQEDVLKQMKPNRYDDSRLQFETDYAWADFNPGRNPIVHYFFRRSGDSLMLIGRWDVTHTVFCRLERNPDSQPKR